MLFSFAVLAHGLFPSIRSTSILGPFLHPEMDSAVGIVTGYGLDDRGVGVRVSVGVRIFSSPRRPDRLWDPSIPGVLSSGGKATRA
jgi:hypothetical protein